MQQSDIDAVPLGDSVNVFFCPEYINVEGVDTIENKWKGKWQGQGMGWSDYCIYVGYQRLAGGNLIQNEQVDTYTNSANQLVVGAPRRTSDWKSASQQTWAADANFSAPSLGFGDDDTIGYIIHGDSGNRLFADGHASAVQEYDMLPRWLSGGGFWTYWW